MLAWEEYGDALLRAWADRLDDARPSHADPPPVLELELDLDGPGPFSVLCLRAGLTLPDAQALAVLLAVETSPERQALVAVLQDDPAARLVTLASLPRVLSAGHPGALVVGEGSRLRRAALVDVDTSGPWATRSVGVSTAVVWALLGEGSLDPGLPEGASVVPGHASPPHAHVLHLVSGADVVSRRAVALSELGGGGLLLTPAPGTRQEWDAVVREATLSGLSVLVELEDDVPPGLDGALRRADLLAWGLSSPAELALARLPDLPRRDVRVPDGTASELDWIEVTGAPAPLGGRYDRRQLQLVGLADCGPADAVRRLSGGTLEHLARRLRPRRGWDDLVLRPELQAQVRDLVTRHRQRAVVFDEWGFSGVASRGTVALLAGPSGTGKTLTAEVVAGELGLDLHVLDLSSIVSKYIGETEKNLGTLFDAASVGDAVLLFDEADALLGRRTAVSDAKDRHANVEVAYLLQRLEQHDGLVLLATNLPNNMDDAFLRRLHATLEFTDPDEPERLAIWQRAFPPGCPTEDLDLALLAREADLTGGAIATAALAAAFAAAAADEPVTMGRVIAAAAAEYRKRGRLSLPPALRA